MGAAAAWVVSIANATLAVVVCASPFITQSSMTTTSDPTMEVARPGLTICERLIFNFNIWLVVQPAVYCNCSL